MTRQDADGVVSALDARGPPHPDLVANQPSASPRDWPATLVFALMLVTTVLRAAGAAVVPLSGDEAYYYDCSRHLDWSYFDQPGLVIWAMVPFRWLLGEVTLAVRAPALLAGLLFGLFAWRIILRLGGSNRHAAIFWGLLHATPLFLFGSAYASTDVAMIACYAGAVLAAMAIADGDRRGWWGFGFAVGLGFLAKYPIVVVLAVLVPVLGGPPARAHLRTAIPWMAALVGMALTMPVWIWGAQHNWDNLRFQFARVPEGFTPLNLLTFWLASLAMLTPTIGLAALIAWLLSRRRFHSSSWQVYRWGAAAPLIFWSVFALRGHVGAHWSAPGTMLSVAAVALVTFRGRRTLVGLGIATMVLIAPLAASVFLMPNAWLQLERRVREMEGRPDKSELAKLFGAEELASEVQKRLRPGELAASDRLTDVHRVSFLTGGSVPTRLFRGRVHGLASLYWHEPQDLLGRDVLFFASSDETLWRLRDAFDAVEPLPPLVIRADGEVVRTWQFYRCRNLRKTSYFTRLESSAGATPG